MPRLHVTSYVCQQGPWQELGMLMDNWLINKHLNQICQSDSETVSHPALRGSHLYSIRVRLRGLSGVKLLLKLPPMFKLLKLFSGIFVCKA